MLRSVNVMHATWRRNASPEESVEMFREFMRRVTARVDSERWTVNGKRIARTAMRQWLRSSEFAENAMQRHDERMRSLASVVACESFGVLASVQYRKGGVLASDAFIELQRDVSMESLALLLQDVAHAWQPESMSSIHKSEMASRMKGYQYTIVLGAPSVGMVTYSHAAFARCPKDFEIQACGPGFLLLPKSRDPFVDGRRVLRRLDRLHVELGIPHGNWLQWVSEAARYERRELERIGGSERERLFLKAPPRDLRKITFAEELEIQSRMPEEAFEVIRALRAKHGEPQFALSWKLTE